MLHPGLIVLDWQRDSKGYEIFENDGHPLVAGKGGAVHPYTVRAGGKNIFIELAGMPHTPAAACIFASKWGALMGDMLEPGVHHLHTPLDLLYCFSDLIKTTVTRFNKAPTNSLRKRALAEFEEFFQGAPYARLEPKLRQNIDDGKPELIFCATNLLDFLHLEMLSALLGGAKPTACAKCGRVTSKSKFAPSKLYCSPRCRKAAERARHREEVDEGRAIVGTIGSFEPEDYEPRPLVPYYSG